MLGVRLPAVEGHIRHPQPPAQFTDGCPRLGPLQHPVDLLLTEPARFRIAAASRPASLRWGSAVKLAALCWKAASGLMVLFLCVPPSLAGEQQRFFDDFETGLAGWRLVGEPAMSLNRLFFSVALRVATTKRRTVDYIAPVFGVRLQDDLVFHDCPAFCILSSSRTSSRGNLI